MLTRDLDQWSSEAIRGVEQQPLEARFEEVGRTELVGDGIALVSGLPRLQLGELVTFEDGSAGFALTLERDHIGVVLLDPSTRIEAGQAVCGSGDVARIPVGESLLGRIVDPLGRPLDEKGRLQAERTEPIERPAPGIIERELVTEPLETGTLIVDAMLALGRGQRELILGDRATGKTTLATDAMIHQRDSDVVSIYVGVGQKSSSLRQVIDAVQEHGAPERTVFVIAPAASSPGLQWLAPFAGFTIAEYFRDRGGHALVVIDDLTKHAATHRELSLLMRQPPGREAYPGDVFYLHARLLERAAKLSSDKGGGSITALPIAETEAGSISGYIPTNLISITDGQIVLDSKLFYEGRRPAIDIGRSVSRVGGKTQPTVLRELAESLRLEYAQFLELELFTRFSATLDDRTRARIAHGRRIRATLQQGQHAPLPLNLQVALLIALADGILDRVPLEHIADFRSRLAAWLQPGVGTILRSIAQMGKLGGAERQELGAALSQLAGSIGMERGK
jgi:F-type H+/Na+-transporting ATPase subunit alpha